MLEVITKLIEFFLIGAGIIGILLVLIIDNKSRKFLFINIPKALYTGLKLDLHNLKNRLTIKVLTFNAKVIQWFK